MIIINHSSLQHSSHHHFSKFNCDARAYAAEADFKDSNHFNEEKQTYHTVSNNNDFKNFDNKEDNSTINFALSESF